MKLGKSILFDYSVEKMCCSVVHACSSHATWTRASPLPVIDLPPCHLPILFVQRVGKEERGQIESTFFITSSLNDSMAGSFQVKKRYTHIYRADPL